MKIPDEVKDECVRVISRAAWDEMTKDWPNVKELDDLPPSMSTPMLDRVAATLAPIWPIIERETPHV